MSNYSEKLKKPIDAHGKTLDVLEMREPEGGDIIDIGHPMSMVQHAGKQKVSADYEVIGNYISALAGIPLSSVRNLHHSDLRKAGDWISGFFADSETET